ncbi:hypothetical protein ACH5RR_004371 [Cinchona calisaya]|uniref:Uncharacterized protein n=1 Tax=Cinchona calisaya TaxID=153742 RepID=A0ABD3AXR4_9GENT
MAAETTAGIGEIPNLRDSELINGENFNLLAAVPALEATWHNLHSLAKTVFSCIYLLRPDRISSHTLLHSYCMVLMMTCNAAVSAVLDARTKEFFAIKLLSISVPFPFEILSTGKWRAFRAMLFMSMGLFGLIPAIHAVAINWNDPHRNITLGYKTIMALSYITGAMFYISGISQRWKPGFFSLTDLRDGELINGENFNLLAAVPALENLNFDMVRMFINSLGIPSMQANFLRLWTQRWSQVLFLIIALSMKPLRKVLLLFLLSFDRTIDIQCNVDIMDHLLACEATWHNGHSLGKTVFSCIYLLRPDRISSHTLLHSYCMVLMVTCNAVVSAVSDARTNETLSAYNCFKDAQRIAKELRSSYSNDPDKLNELLSIEQVAEHDVVALNLVCRLGTLDQSLEVYFEFSHHPYFASAVVKRS